MTNNETNLCTHIMFTVATDESVRYVIVALNIFAMFVAAPGNIITGYVIIHFKSLRKEPTYILIGSVCLADTLVGIVTQPLYISSLFVKSDLSNCGLYQAVFVVGWISAMASIFGVNLITLDRFLYIMYPFKYYKYMSRKRALFLSFTAWLGAIFFGTVSLGWHSSVLLHTASVSHFVLSCIFVGVMYYLVYRSTSCRNKGRCIHAEHSKEHRQRQATRTIVVIITVFFGCWTPWVILSFIFAIQEYRHGSVEPLFRAKFLIALQGFLLTFGFCNSALNVFVYSLKNSVLKKAVLKLVCGWVKRRRGDDKQTVTMTPLSKRMDSLDLL